MLLAYNTPGWVMSIWAPWSSGAVPVLGYRWWSAREVEHAVGVVAPRCLITDSAELPESVTVPVLGVADLAVTLGRSKDIVIRGGENIACAHVETALASHPDVIELAAVGLPHPDLGEKLATGLVVHDRRWYSQY
jgi:acyl-CoA synthetase (AMP-forming)/AMP-acid ligase II